MDFLSDLELDALISKISQIIQGRYINNVYSLDELRYSFTIKDFENSLNVHLDIGVWLSDKYIKERWEGEFIRRLRDFLEGSRIDNLEVPKGQRIVKLSLSSGYLYLELFGGKNVICCDKQGIITCSLKEEEFKERKVKAGELYSLPKLKGMPLKDLPEPPFNEGVSLIKHLGFYLAAPKKLLEEIVFRSGVSREKPANSLSDSEKVSVIRAIKEVVDECYSSQKLYLYEDGTFSLIRLRSKGEPIKEFPVPIGLKDAFDEFLFKVEQEDEEEKKKALAEAYLKKAELLRELAEKIMKSPEDEAVKYITEKGGLIKEGFLSVAGESVKFETLPSAASKLYEIAKNYEAGAKKILASKPKQKEKKVKVVSVRKREWYEKYRWFITSEGFLSVGGRDASSNEAILRKYLKPEDLVFHAELPGSPFFIISSKAGEASIKEVATATASFSRAWRMGLTAADVYYVKGDQVSFSAPSGEYLKKGAAMILGKRNYVKGVKLKLGVGLIKVGEELKVFCGPLSAASKHCDWFLEIEPGKLSQSEAAKKIQKKLSELYGVTVSLEEVQRALPAGNTEVVGVRKRGDIPYI